MRFDVFGLEVVVERTRVGPWTAYYNGTDGKRRPADFPIPSDLGEDEIAQYLDDLFHEHATAEHPEIRLLKILGKQERIKKWLNLDHTLHKVEPEVDGEVEMSLEMDGQQHCFGGLVIIYAPNEEVSFESQWRGPLAFPVPAFWTTRLTPMYDGTQAQLFHHCFEHLGKDAADNLEGYEEGWDIKRLKALRQIAELDSQALSELSGFNLSHLQQSARPVEKVPELIGSVVE